MFGLSRKNNLLNTDIAALRKRNEELIENINHLENEKRLGKISPNQSQDLEVKQSRRFYKSSKEL